MASCCGVARMCGRQAGRAMGRGERAGDARATTTATKNNNSSSNNSNNNNSIGNNSNNNNNGSKRRVAWRRAVRHGYMEQLNFVEVKPTKRNPNPPTMKPLPQRPTPLSRMKRTRPPVVVGPHGSYARRLTLKPYAGALCVGHSTMVLPLYQGDLRAHPLGAQIAEQSEQAGEQGGEKQGATRIRWNKHATASDGLCSLKRKTGGVEDRRGKVVSSRAVVFA